MHNSVLVNDIAQRVGATNADIEALGPLWQGMMRRDDNGHLWISKNREYYLLGALDAEADSRKDNRINEADAELVASYRDLMGTAGGSAPSIRAAARHQKQTLQRVNRVLDALVELVNAKVDRRRMKPQVAAQICDEVDELRHAAQQNATKALDAIRSLLALTA